MKIARTWALAKIVIRGHILNWPWRSRSIRRRVRTDYTARVATQYFKRYLPAARAVVEEPVVKDNKNDDKRTCIITKSTLNCDFESRKCR